VNTDKLIANIEKINELFDKPNIFVASNGEVLTELPQNVVFKKWGDNQGWQLGALNSTLQSIKMAAESNLNQDVIFSHDDIYPINRSKILELMNLTNEYDLICRKYIGPHEQPHLYPYIMIEDFILSHRIIHKFLEIPIYDSLPYVCAEMSFGKIVTDMNLKILSIDITTNSECVENEMGFYHDHKH